MRKRWRTTMTLLVLFVLLWPQAVLAGERVQMEHLSFDAPEGFFEQAYEDVSYYKKVYWNAKGGLIAYGTQDVYAEMPAWERLGDRTSVDSTTLGKSEVKTTYAAHGEDDSVKRARINEVEYWRIESTRFLPITQKTEVCTTYMVVHNGRLHEFITNLSPSSREFRAFLDMLKSLRYEEIPFAPTPSNLLKLIAGSPLNDSLHAAGIRLFWVFVLCLLLCGMPVALYWKKFGKEPLNHGEAHRLAKWIFCAEAAISLIGLLFFHTGVLPLLISVGFLPINRLRLARGQRSSAVETIQLRCPKCNRPIPISAGRRCPNCGAGLNR